MVMAASPESLATPVGRVPRITGRLGGREAFGRLRMRLGIGRSRYRVTPGLYAIGSPSPDSPVLVTANYKLTFDTLRRDVDGIDAWILVLDTDGINVWCAAGKGRFGTEEVVTRVQQARLAELVSHRTIVLPQLAAPGVAAHDVRERTGLRVVYGPVRSRDIGAFLEARMHATEAMRRVTFSLPERAELVGVEVVEHFKIVLPVVLVLALLGSHSVWAGLVRAAPYVVALLVGTVVVPLVLPWIPVRSFALKGAVVGAPLIAISLLLPGGIASLPAAVGTVLAGTAIASYSAMNFTGSSTFTSPSGVEREMRRALPLQVGALVAGLVTLAAQGIWG